MLLLSGDRKTAVAVLLDQSEEIDSASPRFDGVSPVSYALAQADREHLDYVMVVAGATLRLYPAKPGIGTGRRGRSETFVEINLDLPVWGGPRIPLAPPLRARSLRGRDRRGDPRAKRGLRRGSGQPASRAGLPRGHTLALPCCRVGDVAGEHERGRSPRGVPGGASHPLPAPLCRVRRGPGPASPAHLTELPGTLAQADCPASRGKLGRRVSRMVTRTSTGPRSPRSGRR